MIFGLVIIGIMSSLVILTVLYVTLMTRADLIDEYGSVKNYFKGFWEGIKEDITPDCQKEKQEDETEA